MKKLLLSISLCAAVTACSKKDDAPVNKEAMNAPKGDLADVDCEKMTTHTTELLVKAKIAADKLSDDDAAKLKESMTANHDKMVKSCEDEKSTKPMTKKQYACYLEKTDFTEAASCLL